MRSSAFEFETLAVDHNIQVLRLPIMPGHDVRRHHVNDDVVVGWIGRFRSRGGV